MDEQQVNIVEPEATQGLFEPPNGPVVTVEMTVELGGDEYSSRVMPLVRIPFPTPVSLPYFTAVSNSPYPRPNADVMAVSTRPSSIGHVPSPICGISTPWLGGSAVHCDSTRHLLPDRRSEPEMCSIRTVVLCANATRMRSNPSCSCQRPMFEVCTFS